MENEMTLYQAQSMAAPHPAAVAVTNREVQEVQAAVFMAKQFPRDENYSLMRILKSCQRPGLAKKALYSYPKGGTNVTGPSVRLAEAIAQAWGNIQSGVIELDQREGESQCMAFCWDIETNTREIKTFVVKHQISTRNGMKVLTDPREIYELVANQGARRKRACILNIIPGDIVDKAVEECNKTLAGQNKIPLIDRLRELVNLLDTYFSVPLESIERYYDHPLDSFTEMDWQDLAGIYNALREGNAKREDFFKIPKASETDKKPEGKNTPSGKDEKKATGGKNARQVSIDDL